MSAKREEQPVLEGEKLDKLCIVFGEQFFELIGLCVNVYNEHIADNAKLGLQPTDDDKAIRYGLQLWHNLYKKLSPKQRYTGAMVFFENPFLDNVNNVFANYMRDEWLSSNNIVITPRVGTGVEIRFSVIYSWAKTLAESSKNRLLSMGESDMVTDLMMYPRMMQYRLFAIWKEMLRRNDRFTVKTKTDKDTGKKIKLKPTVEDDTRRDYLDAINEVLTSLGNDLYNNLPDSQNTRIRNMIDEVNQFAPKKGGSDGDFISGIFDMAGPLFEQLGIDAPDGSAIRGAGGMESLNATLTSVLTNPSMLQQINGIHDKLQQNDGDNIGDVLSTLTGGLTNQNFIGTIVDAVADSGQAGADAGLLKKKTGDDSSASDASSLVREAMSAADISCSSSSQKNVKTITECDNYEDDDIIIDEEVDFE